MNSVTEVCHAMLNKVVVAAVVGLIVVVPVVVVIAVVVITIIIRYKDMLLPFSWVPLREKIEVIVIIFMPG